MGGAFDFVGDVIDTGGDILGGVGDVIGDVAGGIGDFAGDILENIDIGDALQAFVLSGGNPYAAAIAATDIDESLGFNPGSFMSGDFSSFGDFSGFDPGSVGFDFGAPDLGGFDTSGLGDFSDYLQSAGDFANLPNLGESLGDIVNYADLVNQGGGDFMDYLQTGIEQGGDFTDYLSKLEDFNKLPDVVGEAGDFSDYLSKLEDFNKLPDVPKGIGDIVQGGLDDAIEMYKKYGKPVASIAKLITSYQAGQLSKKQQEELNRKIQQQLDEQKAKQAGFQSKIDTGQLAKMDIRRGTIPTVGRYNPVFAKGGQVRNKYNVGGITELMAGLSLPSIEEILKTYEKYKDPLSELLKYGTSYYAGKLSKKQQEELNRFKQAQYDEQRRKQEEFQNKIERGELAKMDIRRGTTPTVRMAMGGITNIRPSTSMGIMGVNR
jgi:DNA-binding transcriptional MerR regulator